MKHLIFASLLTIISASASAEGISAATSTIGGVATTMEASGCLAGSGSAEGRLCLAAASVSSTITTQNLKEEMKQVEPDAYNFLAGEEMTAALSEQVENVRRLSPETQDMNDQEVVFIIIESIK